MLNYLHDIRNKLTLISCQTDILSKKYGEEDFIVIRTNLGRISELVNDAYTDLKDNGKPAAVNYSPIEFTRQMDLLTETAELFFPITFQNETRDYRTQNHFTIALDVGLVFQVIENAIDNSMKALADKIIIRLFETKEHCIYEIVDNGSEKNTTQPEYSVGVSSVFPHGLGKDIMIQNMQKIGGKVDWTRRLDYSGMIVRLYFPKSS